MDAGTMLGIVVILVCGFATALVYSALVAAKRADGDTDSDE